MTELFATYLEPLGALALLAPDTSRQPTVARHPVDLPRSAEHRLRAFPRFSQALGHRETVAEGKGVEICVGRRGWWDRYRKS